MTIPRPLYPVFLLVLYLAAVWIRLERSDVGQYPYYKGESGTNYRHALLIDQHGTLPELDRRSGWPDGYAPSRVKPSGVEYLAGFAYRLGKQFTDASPRDFAAVFTIFFASLSVFTLYLLGSRLWDCRAAGILAGFLAAFSPALVRMGSGREFVHAPYALVLLSLQWALAARFMRRRSTWLVPAIAVLTLALLATWEGAGPYAAAAALALLWIPGLELAGRKHLLAGHAAGVVLGGLFVTHLRAARFIIDWPAIVVLVALAYLLARERLPRRVPGVVYLVAGCVPLALLFEPLRTGGMDTISILGYGAARLRHLFGKPEDPSALSEPARFLWSRSHAFARPYDVLELLFPLLFMVPVALRSLAAARERAAVRPSIWVPFTAVAMGVYLVDRSALPLATLTLYPLAAAAGFALGRRLRTRAAPVAVGSVLVLAQAFSPYGAVNATYLIGRAIGASPGLGEGFVRASIGDADRELIRHVVGRTSVRDVILAPGDEASLLVAFGGRVSVLTPGVTTSDEAARKVALLSRFYAAEDSLYRACEELEVKYVLYSIDLLLDASAYSARYLAGASGVEAASVAYRMHFQPEALTHFNLEYENDAFRLFRVTRTMEPFFVTDHPPVYDERIFEDAGRSEEVFYERVLDVLVTYDTAIERQRRGNEEEAIRRFRYCLERTPRFTKAWIGVGDSLVRMRDYEAASAAYARALALAPDNTHALYYGALSAAHAGKTDQALGLLDVLSATTRERELLQRANELKAVLKAGIPLSPESAPSPAPAPSADEPESDRE